MNQLLPSVQTARARLAQAGQEHVFTFWDELDASQRERLLEQIAEVDWLEVARLIESHVLAKPKFELPERVEPAPWYPYEPPADLRAKYQEAWQRGEQLVREGKVAAFTVAGGQGTRLGWDAPKGTFPATPIRGLSLFGCFAEYLRNIQNRYGVTVPWYIMTSPINHRPTVTYFEENNYFGLSAEHVKHFPQGMLPAIDMTTGKVLLADKSELALSPNGHGGSLKALHTSGALADMSERGIEQISYTQVDNPIVRVVDPIFLGLHAMDDAQMSSKMLPKREPLEKLGNFCLVDGKMTVIEYSDLPEELARETLESGDLRFRAGSIAIHTIRRDFVESLNDEQRGGFGLPYHRAQKKVPHIDIDTGEPVEPATPNAVKLETFVFDALPLTSSSIIYETSRADEFAPIKNADTPGAAAQDSPQTSKLIQGERAARWLEAAGVTVPRNGDAVDATLEVSQLTAIYPDDLKSVALPERIEPGEARLI